MTTIGTPLSPNATKVIVKRRMGVALAFDADVELARTRAKLAASKVRPRVAGHIPA